MCTDPLSGHGHGAEPLIGAAELEHLRRITLQHRSRRYRPFPAAAGAGARPSRWRGQGMELHDARPYQPGDDIRHIDWRATARSGKPVSKVFVEERARSLFLLIDRRPSMMFGTRRELKAATAARVAAILAFSALAEREPVAGLVIDDELRYFPPVRTVDAVFGLLRAATAAPLPPSYRRVPPPTPAMAPALPEPLAAGTACCLISDFEDVLAGTAGLESLLPAQAHAHSAERIALRIVDAAERELPDAGVLRLAPPGGGPAVLVDTGNPELRARYRAAIAERDRRLRDDCLRHGVDLLEIRSDLALPAQLDALL